MQVMARLALPIGKRKVKKMHFISNIKFLKIMKKQIFSWGLMLAATFTLTNCAQELDNPVQPETEGFPFELVASTPEVKTVNDGMTTKWATGDKINVFHAIGESTEYKNDGAFTVEDVNAGVFAGELCEPLDPEEEYDWYVLYPYNQKIETPGAQTAGYTYIGYSTGLTQTGYNSTASLKGSVCPLYGVLKYGGVEPELEMQHLSSVVAIKVTNKNDEPLTVTTASFTATEDIVGSYFIDLTGESVAYTASGANYVKNTAVVNVSNGTALAKGESAVLYAAIKPFTAPAGQKLTLSVNGYSKEITLSKDVTFTAGKIKTLNFAYEFVAEPEPEGTATYSWDLTKASYASASASEVKWESDYVNMVLTKGGSSTTANNYLGGTNAHTRVYKDQVLTFKSADGVVVQSVEFNVVSGYIDEFEGATWTNATATTSGLVRKVVPTDSSKDFSVKIGTATRFTSVTVHYVLDGNYVPPTLESIKVENAKTEYYVGDAFVEPDVIAVYDNGNEIPVSEGVTFTGFDSSAAAETQVVTVTYEGKTCTYNVTISEKQESGDGDSTQEYTYTWTATSGALGNNAQATISKILNQVEWTIQRSGSSGYTGWTSSVIQIGKNGSAESLTLKTSGIEGVVKEIAVECASYSGKHNVAISVGGTEYVSTITPSWTTVGTVGASGTSSGDIEIKFTPGTGARALYVKSIKIVYAN